VYCASGSSRMGRPRGPLAISSGPLVDWTVLRPRELAATSRVAGRYLGRGAADSGPAARQERHGVEAPSSGGRATFFGVVVQMMRARRCTRPPHAARAFPGARHCRSSRKRFRKTKTADVKPVIRSRRGPHREAVPCGDSAATPYKRSSSPPYARRTTSTMRPRGPSAQVDAARVGPTMPASAPSLRRSTSLLSITTCPSTPPPARRRRLTRAPPRRRPVPAVVSPTTNNLGLPPFVAGAGVIAAARCTTTSAAVTIVTTERGSGSRQRAARERVLRIVP
jgi:hypothetical protein